MHPSRVKSDQGDKIGRNFVRWCLFSQTHLVTLLPFLLAVAIALSNISKQKLQSHFSDLK
jgi:hypothetical protein